MFAATVLVGLAAPALPTPYDLDRAESLIRHPEAAADVAPPARERLAVAAVGRRLGVVGDGDWLAWDEATCGVYYALRERLAERESCPPDEGAARLPPSAWCDEAAAWNRGLAAHWRERATWETDRAEVLEAAAREADGYAAFWSEASFARWDRADATRRRQALRFVRDAIGAEAYAAGDWPAPGPFHRLTPR